MSTDEWKVCIDSRKEKRRQRRMVLDQCPHLILPEKAQKLQTKLNIDDLATTLLSDVSKDLQQQGWIYIRVIRPGEDIKQEDGWEYTTIDQFNKWSDRILFRKKINKDS